MWSSWLEDGNRSDRDTSRGQEVEAETAAALGQKLLQMASGVLYDTLLEEKPDGGFRKRRVVYALHRGENREATRVGRRVLARTDHRCILA